jgi:hypothetical protein
VALAKDLKKHGFRFVGPTTAYAMMQACGLVDDHLADCHVRGPARTPPAARPGGAAAGATRPAAGLGVSGRGSAAPPS